MFIILFVCFLGLVRGQSSLIYLNTVNSLSFGLSQDIFVVNYDENQNSVLTESDLIPWRYSRVPFAKMVLDSGSGSLLYLNGDLNAIFQAITYPLHSTNNTDIMFMGGVGCDNKTNCYAFGSGCNCYEAFRLISIPDPFEICIAKRIGDTMLDINCTNKIQRVVTYNPPMIDIALIRDPINGSLIWPVFTNTHSKISTVSAQSYNPNTLQPIIIPLQLQDSYYSGIDNYNKSCVMFVISNNMTNSWDIVGYCVTEQYPNATIITLWSNITILNPQGGSIFTPNNSKCSYIKKGNGDEYYLITIEILTNHMYITRIKPQSDGTILQKTIITLSTFYGLNRVVSFVPIPIPGIYTPTINPLVTTSFCGQSLAIFVWIMLCILSWIC